MRSDETVPVRFWGKQRAKYCLLLLTANCIAAKMCLRDSVCQADLRIPDHRRQEFQPSLSLLLFKTRFKSPPGWPQPQVFRGYFFNSSQYSKQRPNFSAHRVTLITKTDLILPAFSFRFADFAVEFCFRCKFSFHDKCPLLRIVINGIASFCLDNRLRQVALFRVRQSGHRPAQALCWRILK